MSFGLEDIYLGLEKKALSLQSGEREKERGREKGRGGHIPSRGLDFKMRRGNGDEGRPTGLWRESGIVTTIIIILSYLIQSKKAMIVRCPSISEKLKNMKMI